MGEGSWRQNVMCCLLQDARLHCARPGPSLPCGCAAIGGGRRDLTAALEGSVHGHDDWMDDSL
jgi:hypothetical protein